MIIGVGWIHNSFLVNGGLKPLSDFMISFWALWLQVCKWEFNVLVHCVLQGTSLFIQFLFGSRTFICAFTFLVFVCSDKRSLWDMSGMHLHRFIAFISCPTGIFSISVFGIH